MSESAKFNKYSMSPYYTRTVWSKPPLTMRLPSTLWASARTKPSRTASRKMVLPSTMS